MVYYKAEATPGNTGLEYKKESAYRSKFEDSYKLAKKYGNCFTAVNCRWGKYKSDFNGSIYLTFKRRYSYYWSYFTREGKNYIYTLTVLREKNRTIAREEHIIEYNKDINWISGYDQISLRRFCLDKKITAWYANFWYFQKEDTEIMAYRVPLSVYDAKEKNPDGIWDYDYLDNLLEDLFNLPILPKDILKKEFF